MSKSWRFEALDTLFFRDGTPFHQGETGNILPGSVFPPLMLTMQGAIRTALACKQGWIPDKKGLPEKLRLGTADDLGDLQLAGPYLRFKGERLYPAPLTLFGNKNGNGNWILTRLIPGPKVDCDLGEGVRLPKLQKQIDGELLNLWVTKEGMESILNIRFPEAKHLIEPDQLWKNEQKIGIMREEKTKVAKDKHLYSLIHIRPQAELEVEVEVGGISEDWHLQKTQALPLGGEGRFALVNVSDVTDPLPRMPELPVSHDGQIRFTVTLLTPGYYQDMNQVVKEGPPHIPGTCVSASIGKAMHMGGWNLKENKPRPIKPLLPPGSTWFFEAKADQLAEIKGVHGSFTGEKTAYGMGQLIVGIWKEEWED
ncbi:CRISPR-associated Cmr3 family protein [Laceyella sacchari]|uniref:type III-B CRISPR module-associated Cmr3 family protein n=1 Tax=Laceyella sacchari TaxID=37482 RepID=UPI001046DBBA|nr:type III-B CRISPR module-associated Cmr3 family protein [Laceyella sacchari]TCW35054.1 CRISPR-associated Cmr3 family protein [Laceyella sacchari]